MKIKTFNKFNESRNSLIQPSDKQIEEAEEYLAKGIESDWDMNKFGFFYIDVSGKYSVYYTLWRFKPSTYSKPEQFISNLSTDFQTAVEKAKKAAGRVPVIIDRYGTKTGMFQAAKAELITFGKHRGKTLGEVFVEDPQYIMWLANNYDGRSKERFEKLQYYKELYLETITKRNLEESKSEYVGKIGEKISLRADVYKVESGSNEFNGKIQYSCNLVDDKGNKYKTYNIGKPVKKGDTVIMTAKVKDHKELLGVKFTYLYFCKVTSIFNLQDDMSKFNL